MAQFRVPEELIVETLLCLPVKSLLRFRCLSKALHAVIDSPNFINSHLSKSSQNPNRRKLIIQSLNNFHVCDMNLDVDEDIIHLTKTFSSLRNEIYGYCNGLILVSRSSITSMHQNELELSLWNPSTRHYMDLPDCPCELRSLSALYNLFGSGLGYDDSTDAYKAFFIVPSDSKDELRFEFDVEVWIYELKFNIWRRAENFPYPVDRVGMNLGFDGLGCFADGNVYCLCKIMYSGIWQLQIVEFDVRKETFSLVPQPVCSMNSGGIGFSTKLHVLEGCLYISYISSSMPRDTEIYIRKNDEVGQFTWTLLFCVSNPLFYDILTVLRYSKKGDKILLYNSDDYLVSYDVKEKSFGRVNVDIDCRWHYPILCLESLVPLGGGA